MDVFVLRLRRFVLRLVLPAALIGGGALLLLMPFDLTNIAETRLDHSDALLRTRRYAAPPGGVGGVVEIVNTLIPTLTTYARHWRLVAPAPSSDAPADANTRTVTAEVPVLIFTDDLHVSIKRGAHDGEVSVDVRSASRVGKSDLGENRRHIIQLLRDLDAKLAP